MSARLEDLQEWHFREFCDATGLQVPWRDLREHLVAVERMSVLARTQWALDQELEQERESYDVHAKRRIERAWARGADTEVGRALAGHDARHSATIRWWLSNAILSAESRVMDTGQRFTALTANTDPFVLVAGRYGITCDIGGASAVALETRSPAGGDVWLLVPSRQVASVSEGEGGGTLDVGFAADGVLTADLAAGEYRIAVTHSEGTGAAVALSRI